MNQLPDPMDQLTQMWLKFEGLDEDNIPEHKKDLYRTLKPMLRELLNPYMNTPDDRTEGEKLIGLNRLPSDNPAQQEIQKMNSKMLDTLLEARKNPNNSYHRNLLIGAAIVAIIEANLITLKAILHEPTN